MFNLIASLTGVIIMTTLTWFCWTLMVLEIIATFSPPVKDGLEGYNLKRNIYRVSLIIILQLGVLVAWLCTTP